ncbi:hypothetical protein QR680_014815 [Steinernema hermaphroditum]|uniref:MADF domain-containing protein n=1 Tax=Steinernema hermaphroditum TaxID=289476 RepID=A0AA39M3V3_9BILA|nr:hypothetical protein QR680_014815 [Steinernema hermaphroditum]
MASEKLKSDIIEAVREQPLVWDFRLPNYVTEDIQVLWETITAGLKDRHPELTVSLVTQVWKNLKDYYRKKKPKPQTGSSAEDVKAPRWIHFKSMKFLDKTESTAVRISSDSPCIIPSCSQEYDDANSDKENKPPVESSSFHTPKSRGVKRAKADIIDNSIGALSSVLLEKHKNGDSDEIMIEKELMGMAPPLKWLLKKNADAYRRTMIQIKRLLLDAEEEMFNSQT